MAFNIRDIDTVFQELLQEKQTFTSLDGLLDKGITSENTLIPLLDNGQAPEWVNWLHTVAVGGNLTDINTQAGIDVLTDIFNTKKPGTAAWYVDIALAFQYGDTYELDPITRIPKYAEIDESKQIIASVTTLDLNRTLNLKIRRKDTDILTVDEKNAFDGYMFAAKEAGTELLNENFDGDKLTLNIDLKYDPSFDLNTVKSNVESTILDYIENLPFDSIFVTNQLVDSLQSVDGVVDPRFKESQVLDSLGNLTDFTFEFQSNAGWCQINSDTPLSDTINYFV